MVGKTKYGILFVLLVIVVISIYFRFQVPSLEGIDKNNGVSDSVDKLADIPTSLGDVMKSIQVSDTFIKLSLDGKIIEVQVKEARPFTSSHLTVVFLHGATLSTELWQLLLSLQLVAAMGHRSIALDLPGWGRSTGSQLRDKNDRKTFLKLFFEQMNISKPVLVSPSMSGMYSIGFMMDPHPDSCSDRLKGLVALAPTSVNEYTDAEYHRCKIPTAIVIGSKDVKLGILSVGFLRNMPHSKIYIIRDAGHVCYKDKPNDWNKILYHYLTVVSASL